MMKLHAIGMAVRHTADFVIDRPAGSGDDLLIIFKTPAELIIGGEVLRAQAGCAIVYTADMPQYYRAFGGIYVNHFMHFEGYEQAEDTPLPPAGKLIALTNIGEVEELLRMISRTRMGDEKNMETSLDLLIKLLMIKLSEGAREPQLSADMGAHHAELSALRAELYSSACEFRGVGQMAKRLNFSVPYLQQLYRAQFGVSCYEDILAARTKTAKYYLRATTLTVKEIAALCGYENDVCFMRLFKQRTGLTPTLYREKRGLDGLDMSEIV